MFVFPSHALRTLAPSRPKTLLLALSALCNIYLLLRHSPPPPPPPFLLLHTQSPTPPPTSLHHLLFSVASSAASLPRRAPYLRLWYSPNSTRALVFLDRAAPFPPDPSLPLIAVSSADASRFPYTFPRGLRSAIRVARIVKEAVDRRESDVRWFVFGDDDTVFFSVNLVKVLAKYDHHRWYYIGASSESYEQNVKNSFDMAFGGGGFAISHSLAVALARVFDSCLMRYPHLYGSDARIYSCLAELGIGLTRESGFHQVDIRGNLFGMLSAHPLSPLVSLHHMDSADSIFPNMSRTQAMMHLFKAVDADPARILQQMVCYDRSYSLSFSLAWGFAIQVFEGNQLLPDLLSVQRTFMPWKRGSKLDASHYMFNTREIPRDPCKRPTVFFLESVIYDMDEVRSEYARNDVGSCPVSNSVQNFEKIVVLSRRLEMDAEQLRAPRRECCDVLTSSGDLKMIKIRHCGQDELITMQS